MPTSSSDLLVIDEHVMPVPIHAWDRRPRESAPAYEAFRLYRDMGVNRTQRGVATEVDKRPSLIAKWNKMWDWEIRVRAYERYLEIIEEKEFERVKRESVRRQAKLGQKLQQIADTRAQQFIESPALQATLTAADMSKLAKDGVNIERLAHGNSTANVAQGIQIAWSAPPPEWAPKSMHLPTTTVPQLPTDTPGVTIIDRNAQAPAPEETEALNATSIEA